MKTYLKRLKGHPGLPVLAIITPAMVIAGIANESATVLQGTIIGAVAVSPFWLIVLWTARTQPLPKEPSND